MVRPETITAPALRATLVTLTSKSETYRRTDFAPREAYIDPESFYESSYDRTLIDLIEHVVACEAPVAETPLVQAIARAHGFRKAGSVIRERVARLVQRHFHSEVDVLGRCFVWPDAEAAGSWSQFRLPSSEDDIRQIEDIALPELRAAALASNALDVPVDVARQFGVRRLSVTARARIEQAMAGC